jgi:AcrR family transcriptional regulator
MSGSEVNPRRYDNTSRQRQAAATRLAVLQATRTLVIEKGYAGTTIAAVARAAGVSVETVYKGFGNKRELVMQMLGVIVVGDDEPVALIERPEMREALTAGDGAQVLARFAAVSTGILERLGPPLAALLAGNRSGADELREFIDDVNARRRADFTTVVDAVISTGDLREDLHPTRATDILWALGSPEVHLILTGDLGWSHDDYQAWLTQALIDGLIRRS